MSAITFHVPNSDQPTRPAKAAQLAKIRARAKASEAVVNLLCELAYGSRPEWGWSLTPKTSAWSREAA